MNTNTYILRQGDASFYIVPTMSTKNKNLVSFHSYEEENESEEKYDTKRYFYHFLSDTDVYIGNHTKQ